MAKSKHYAQQSMLAPVLEAKDFATKEYVDEMIEGTRWNPAKAAAAGNLAGTMNADNETFTGSANGALPAIDGVTLAENDRVLLWQQSDKTQNGLYVVADLGDASTPWALIRSSDANQNGEFRPNKMVYVLPGGAEHGDQSFKQTTAVAVTVGITPIEFAPDIDTGKVTSEEGSFTGDGSLSEFTVTHGFGTDKIQVDVQDENGALCVFRIRKTVANVVVSADFAIPAGEKFIVVMHGQAEA